MPPGVGHDEAGGGGGELHGRVGFVAAGGDEADGKEAVRNERADGNVVFDGMALEDKVAGVDEGKEG